MRTSPSQANDPRASDRDRTAAADTDASVNEKTGSPCADGASSNGASSAADGDRARTHFNEAMESLPHGDRAAYGEAMERAPRLVEIESNPDHYLDHAELDPWKAAGRLAAYWDARVELFGNRAFLPLTISGEGAMSQEDVDLLESGFFMVLPNESQGRPVLLHDRARLPMNAATEGTRRHRCLFYILSALSSVEANRKSGFIIVSPLVKTTRKATLENAYNARAMKLIQDEVFPIRYVETHIVILSTRSVFMTFTTCFLQLALRFGISKSRITIHNHAQSASAADDALRGLQDHGFAVEGIPAVPFGGMFTIGCFREWLADRRRLEHFLHDSSSASEKFQVHDTETRKRRADASYCRKKRFLKKIEVDVMQEEVERLRRQNGRLKEEETRLQECLLRAQKVVEDQAQCRSRVPASVPLHGLLERTSMNGILRALVGAPRAVPSAPASASAALARSDLLSDPSFVGRNGNSSWLGWSDLPSGTIGLATLSSAPSGAPVPVQLFPSVRSSLSLPSPSRYNNNNNNNNQQLLRTLVGTTAPASGTDPAADALLARALARTLHTQPLPPPTAHFDRSRLQLFQERTERREDLRHLLAQQLLLETLSTRQRGRYA